MYIDQVGNYQSWSWRVSVLFMVRMWYWVFTRESSYCFQRVLAITILSVCLSVRPSVRPSVTPVDQSKTVRARITKFLLLAAWKILQSRTVKLFRKFEGGHAERGR